MLPQHLYFSKAQILDQVYSSSNWSFFEEKALRHSNLHDLESSSASFLNMSSYGIAGASRGLGVCGFLALSLLISNI